MVRNSGVLAFYDVTKPVGLSCDSSAYGLEAVIFHEMPDGTERPIAFASRTLTSSEGNYAQGEKEALTLDLGCDDSVAICMAASSAYTPTISHFLGFLGEISHSHH